VSRTTFFSGSLTVLALAFLDVLAKYWAITSAPPANDTHLSPFLSFALHKNPGIAFDIPIPFFIILPVSLLICGTFLYFTVKTFKSSPSTALAALTVIVGALGNLLDRAVNGFTTDYLILFRTSAINLSDALIVIGMIGFLWYHKEDPSPRTNQE
jgi:signal peptidase II